MATEKRLIDANEAYEAVIDLSGQADTKSAYAAFWKAGKEIQKLPTVDAVEVVRCKVCKHWNEETCFCDKHSAFYFDGMNWDMFDADDFCSYGERRTDGR